MVEPSEPPPHRGTASNPPNRFEPWSLEPDPDGFDPDDPPPATRFYKDQSTSILSINDSPDLGFSVSINPYRGCEHGCIYCYARPTHEYLGFSAGLDFETRILIKEQAPALLRRALSSPRWQPQIIALSGVTDCYQPIERHLKLTRQCLAVLAEYRNPVGIVTKNELVTRDLDLLRELARHQAVAVSISLPTMSPELRRVLEPRTSPPPARLSAIRKLTDADIPTAVLVAPVIPGLTDHEIPSILKTAATAGARFAAYQVLRLPGAVAPLFEQWLEQHAPEKKEKILNRIRALRSGRLNDPRFGERQRGVGIFADQIRQLFEVSCRQFGLNHDFPELSSAAFRRPGDHQLELW